MRVSIILIMAICALFLSGCCKTCPPPKIVPVYKTCKLPGPIVLEFPALVKEGCAENHICFEKSEFGKMVMSINKMVLWIKQARIRCGSKQPSTQPSG